MKSHAVRVTGREREERVMPRKITLVVTAVVSAAAIAAGAASAGKPSGFAVCHFDDDGVASAPVTLWLGSATAVAQHVANHTLVNGHEGDDYAGQCLEPE